MKVFSDSVSFSRGISAVYAILNRKTGRIYIGASLDISNRKRQHRFDLIHGVHRSKRMQEDFDADPGILELILVEVVSDPEILLLREQFWMDFYQSYNPESGYNSCPRADSAIGLRWSAGDRNSKSVLHSGKPQPWLRKPLIQMDNTGKEIRRFDSITEASAACGFSRPNGNISSAAGGKQKSAYGYRWRYAGREASLVN